MIEHQLAAVPAGDADEDARQHRQQQADRQHGRFGSPSRRPQFMPAIEISITAATAWVQLAARLRMPGTSSSSAVPAMLAAMPSQKAKPLDHRAARAQNGSAVHQ